MVDTEEVGLVPHEVLKNLTGLEFMQGLAAGKFTRPPFSRLSSIDLVHAEVGMVRFTGTPKFEHYNPMGMVHGGWTSMLLDSAMGCAVLTTTPRGALFTTLELKVNFVRALSERTGLVTCEGRVVHAGRKVATAEGKLVDAKGNLLAHGSTTCMIVEI